MRNQHIPILQVYDALLNPISNFEGGVRLRQSSVKLDPGYDMITRLAITLQSRVYGVFHLLEAHSHTLLLGLLSFERR